MSQYSNSGYLDGEDLKVSDVVDKVGVSEYNHDLLSSVEGQAQSTSNGIIITPEGEDNPVIQLSHQMLRANNRFSGAQSAASFTTQGQNSVLFEARINDDNKTTKKTGTVNIQNTFGEYNSNNNQGTHTYGNLKSLGMSILLKAGGWDNADSPADSLDPDGDIDFSKNPTIETTTQTVDASAVKSQHGFGAPVDGNGNPLLSNRGFSQRSKVQSSIYNPDFPFSGKQNAVKRMHAVGALLTIRAAVDIFLSAIENVGGSTGLVTPSEEIETVLGPEPGYRGPGPKMYGSYKPGLSSITDIIKKSLGVKTEYPYKNCFDTGMKILFSINSKNDSKEDVVEKTESETVLSDSDSFWLNASISVLRRSESVFEKMANLSTDVINDYANIINELRNSSLFINVIATIGDIHLRRTGGRDELSDFKNVINDYDVDALPDQPGTRVMKSRRKSGVNSMERSISVRSMPSMYLLPSNVINAAIDLGDTIGGVHPAKGMLGSQLIEKTYIDRNMYKSFNRIPNNIVKIFEDRLEGEYVPFYIQDLRTNEILAFHAFLGKLSDTITPEYTSVDGYGRMDSVKIYNKTTRSLSLDFTMVATNKEDYDEMWYKINKFTTLLYPQWTKGSMMYNDGSTFIQPFSQVIGASPIVRLRVGDVIKSNYSRFNLARTFGIGDEGVNASPRDGNKIRSASDLQGTSLNDLGTGLGAKIKKILLETFYLMYGSPLQYSAGSSNAIVGALTDAASELLINGFVNPIAASLLMGDLMDPDSGDYSVLSEASLMGQEVKKALKSAKESPIGKFLNSANRGYTPKFSMCTLKPNRVNGYYCPETNMRYKTTAGIRVFVIGKETVDAPETNENLAKPGTNFHAKQRQGVSPTRTVYTVLPLETNMNSPVEAFSQHLQCSHADLSPDIDFMFNTRIAPILAIADPIDNLVGGLRSVVQSVGAVAGIGADKVAEMMGGIGTDSFKFMLPSKNPITRAFESSMGRGLAGTIGGVTFNWIDDFGWETDFNSRAPKGVTISFNFDVIHDIAPGLDHSGYNRAPLYNVGSIMENIAGDPNTRLQNAKENYKRSAGQGVNSTATTTKKIGS